MIKSKELSDARSCINKAADDEPVFVLRAKDPVAPFIVRAWALASGQSQPGDKIAEAENLAREMELWKRSNNEPNTQHVDAFGERLTEAFFAVSYKDWLIQWRWVNGGALVWWEFVVDGVLWKSRKWYVSQHATTSEIVQTLLKAVLTAEEHEAREHFTYKGRPVFAPHHHVDALRDLPQDVRPTSDEHEVASREVAPINEGGK